MNKKSPNIQDVARAAGVSTATVSRAISNPSLVSEAAREAVFDAIRRTGYHINMAARNLRRRRTGMIVVLVPNLGNPFFSRILSGIEQAAAPAELSVLIVDTKQPQAREEQIFAYLHNTRADGLISLDGSLLRDLLERRNVADGMPPMVFACEWADDDRFSRVVIDNAAGAELAIRHLHTLGHRHIGHVKGPEDNVLTQTRLEGTKRGLLALGLEIVPKWLFAGDFTLASGVEAARAWLALETRPTAVFCASDQMACGFISELTMRGYKVPQDVSVVGFDDIEIASRYIPPLTTVHQPRNDIGKEAARLLIERIENATTTIAPAVKEMLPVELVVRQSSARIA